ncbi:hypothetical protein Tco_0877712 [Tanacetum coccineum]|uniref:Reverse transcriptase domain-containing protein n=1 Tax=Tanacetum coccineum TaxID=301880 RepID=A0ABQ5BYK8_9ASTR
MDWLSKRKFVIVCHEKVVEIPLEGSRKLRVQGERTLGAAKALMNAKVNEPKVGDISVVRDFVDVFPEDFSGLLPQRQVEFRIDLVHGATLVAKSPYRLAPLEMQELSEQLRELQDKGFIRCNISYFQACSFMLCDLDFWPSSLSLSSMPSCDLVSLTNMLILFIILKALFQSLRKSLSLNLELLDVCLC